MAFIKIISLPNGMGSACTRYTYKQWTPTDKGSIGIGEVAEVPDEELAAHLATEKVMQVIGPESATTEKRRGRPPAMSKELEQIMEIQR
jgi:hypothetical protein